MNITLTGFTDAKPTGTVPNLSAWKANAAAVLRAILRRAFDVDMEWLRSWGVDRAIEDGAADRRIEDTRRVDLSVEEAHVLSMIVFETVIELHKARGEYAAGIRDPRNDSYTREAFKAVTVHYSETLTARVLNIAIHPEGHADAEIEVTGEGSYWS